MSLSVLLAQKNDVTILDIDPERVSKINKKQSTIMEYDIESWLTNKKLSLSATLNSKIAYKAANFIIIATPTNYDAKTNCFDTESVHSVVAEAIACNPNALIIIKSTIPVGYTVHLQDEFKTNKIIFSPEFLREGMALHDNLFPSRIVIGGNCDLSHQFANLLLQVALNKDIQTLFIPPTEAEAIKLFANTYLAMRVSFFNELDTYACANNLDARSVIDGVCLDKRIGIGYNNPSFGYGGYCLPKDTKQLLANYNQIPQALIEAIVSSNKLRKNFIADEIIMKKPDLVGIYRLAMKEGSDNYRFSAIQDILKRVEAYGIDVLVFEPLLESKNFFGSPVCTDLKLFKDQCDIIVTNRFDDELIDVQSKVFTRDIYREN